MSAETQCILKQIRDLLIELNDRVVSRSNSHIIIDDIDTSVTTVRKIDINKEFGIRKANDLTILDLGGGFTIAKNGEKAVTASLDLTYEDEDITVLEVTGAGVAGTGKLRLGAYISKSGA